MTVDTLIGRAKPPALHVMSFNIRRAMDGPLHPRRDRWSVRSAAVRELLAAERPTIIGLQEALPRALDVVRAALGTSYRVLGRGRGRSGAGEGNPLIFDEDRLELKGWGQRALSDRPDDPGSRGWGNLIPRVFVWAELSERSTGDRFVVVNTHLDHLSPRSRRLSARAIGAFVLGRPIPTIVIGDLNAGAGSAAVRTLLAGGRLIDVWESAERPLTPRWGTFPGYRAPRADARRIDWMFVTPDIRVGSVAHNGREFDGIRPSDHLAVQALLRTGERTA